MHPAGIGQRQVAERLRIVAGVQRETHAHVVGAVADENLGDRGAAHAVLDQIGDIGDVDAVAGRGRTIGLDRDLRERRLLKDRGLGGAPGIAQDIDDLAGDPAILGKIVAHDLHDQCAVRAAHQVEHHVADRLVDANAESRQLLQPRIELAYEVGLGLARGPGVIGRQPDRSLDVRGRPGVDGGILAAELGHDVADFREFAHGAPQLVRHLAGSFERQAARHLDLKPEAALVQIRQVVPADRRAKKSDRDERDDGREV